MADHLSPTIVAFLWKISFSSSNREKNNITHGFSKTDNRRKIIKISILKFISYKDVKKPLNTRVPLLLHAIILSFRLNEVNLNTWLILMDWSCVNLVASSKPLECFPSLFQPFPTCRCQLFWLLFKFFVGVYDCFASLLLFSLFWSVPQSYSISGLLWHFPLYSIKRCHL